MTRPASSPSIPWATSRNCNPINKNSVDSNMKISAFQKPWASIRAVALNRPSLRAPRKSPTVTAARMPDAPSASAAM